MADEIAKIRKGKTLVVSRSITYEGQPVMLDTLDLQAVVALKGDEKEYILDLSIEGNVFEATWQGNRQISEEAENGKYVFTLWQNRGKENETVVDTIAFKLVDYTFKENDGRDELEIYTLNLGELQIYDDTLREIIKVRDEAKEIADKLNTAYENGEFNGKDGVDGNVIFPTFSIDAAGCIVVDTNTDSVSSNFVIDDDGCLCVEIPNIE